MTSTAREGDATSNSKDERRVEFCPICGNHVQAFRRGYIRLYKELNLKPKLPSPHICMCCGLDMRRVKIDG
jgi:hypothetical protein